MTVPAPPPLPPPHRDGSRTWHTRTLRAQIAWLRSALVDLDRRAGEIVPRACADSYGGVSSGREASVSGGGPADPVAGAVLRGDLEDDVSRAMAAFVGGLVLAREGVARMVVAADRLLPLSPEEVEELLTAEGGRLAAHCETCGRWVAGTEADRLRSGRCQACWRYRLRHGVERPRELWEGDEP